MKKIIHNIFVVLLICFSFFYTDKVINMINKKDPLMTEIINYKEEYNILPINAYIDGDTIVPGLIGTEIDVEKSYQNMKLGGIFREESLIFKDLYPQSSISSNKNKYIIKGNNNKKEVSIITVLNNNIDKIKPIEDITVFINHKDLTTSNIKLLKEKEIYPYGNNGIYNNETLVSDSSLINRLSNNKSLYCLTKEKNINTLNTCNKNNMYTVIPTIIGDYYNIKKELSNGSIILLDNLNNIDIIIKYIKSKGYNIVPLSILLSE